jgi:hypothetical protein
MTAAELSSAGTAPHCGLYSRNAYDWTVRLAAIAAAAEGIKAKSFTLDGEAVVLGSDGLSSFEELRRRTAAHAAILYAFDLIEYDGEDRCNLPFLDRKSALAALLRDTKAGILLNEHCRRWSYRVRPGRGHRFQAGRRCLPVWPVPRLDQGPQSRQHRRAAGAEQEVE